jgi:hypothetical protein
VTSLPLRSLLPLGIVLIVLAGCGSGSSSGSSATSTPAPTSPATSSTGTPAAAPTPPATPGKAAPTPPPPATPVVTGSVAAVINGHSVPIPAYRLNLIVAQRRAPTQSLAAVEKQAKQETIYNELIRQYAATHGIHVTAAEIAAQVQQQVRGLGSQAKFRQALAQQLGITVAQYRELVGIDLLAQKVEREVARVKGVYTDAQAKAKAEQILNQLRHGADFATLARKFSGDTGSAAKGGDLGDVFPGQTVPPFDHAAFHAPLKTYVLVHSSYGYHIVEVLSRGLVNPPGLPHGPKRLGAHVRHILFSTSASSPQQQQEQTTAFIAWLQQQQKQATIKWEAKTQSAR